MADFRALTIQSGIVKQQQDADNLVVGAGIKTLAGNLTLSSAGGTTIHADHTQLAAGKNLTALAGAGSLDFSLATGDGKLPTGNLSWAGAATKTASLVGAAAFTITAGAASTWSSSAGALTITSAAAATWSTAAGALTLNGAGGINLQGGGTTALVVNAAGTALTVQAGATLGTTGTGMINLPSLFQINGAAVSVNVTAANLGTLTAGGASNADALHTHAITNAGQIVVTGLTTTGIGDGDFVYVSANNVCTKTDALALASSRCFGANEGTAGSVTVAGIIENTKMTTAGGSPGAGAAVWLAASTDDSGAGAGKCTATAPSTAGQFCAEVGICMDNGAYAGSKTSKILLQVKTVISL